MRHTVGKIILLLVLSLLLVGCADFVDADQPVTSQESSVSWSPNVPVGQTFVARHGGLNGLDVWLAPPSPAGGELTLHLRSEPAASQDLLTATLGMDAATTPGFYHFSFPPERDSHSEYYYAFLTLEGEGRVPVGQAPGAAYLDGAAYVNHEPQDAQLAFRLTYDPLWMVVELAGAAVRGVGLLIVALLLYAVPGWALLAWLWPSGKLTWSERLGLAVGISLALYPLLLLWTDLVGLHLGAFYAWLPVAGGLAALVWRYRDWRPRQGWETLRRWACSEAVWPDLTLLIVLALVFGVRLLVVRTLDAPMWGDSYQHTMIAQLLVDNGGLFDSWGPYTPYRSLTIHFGFPMATALLTWVTGLSALKGTLLAGQLLNGLAILTLYPLAVRVAHGRRWAGTGALLAAGLLSQMPAYYVNWGRYAQLAGQVILPVAIWLLWDLWEEEEFVWKVSLVTGMVLAGMTLNYYRMPFYCVAFIVAWLLTWGIAHWKFDWRRWWIVLLRGVVIAIIALLLFTPWIGRLVGSDLATSMERGMTSTSSWERIWADYQVWRDLFFYVPRLLVLAALVALVWAIVKQCWEAIAVGGWVLILGALVAGQAINLPGANFMQNFAVLIVLYIPVGVLSGWLLGEIANVLPQHSFTSPLLTGMLFLVALLGTKSQLRIVDISFVMVTRPDIRALAWIEGEVPADANFLVEGFRIYDGRSAVGADAGWWLPLLTQRQNTIPPQYALLTEQPVEPAYNQDVVDLVAALEKTPLDSAQGLSLLCKRDITHVYVGQGQGNVGAGVRQLFAPSDLVRSAHFNEIYHRDRVHIFAVDTEVCER